MWLAEDRAGTTIAITHGGFIRAAVAHAKAAPPKTIWRIQIDPLSITELAQIGAAWQIIRGAGCVTPRPRR
jgi:broad specificity phosphatase PhoE